MIKKVNKGAESDYRASKLDKLTQTYRDVRSGASFATDGFAQQDFRCVKCGTVNRAGKQAGSQTRAPCSKCRTTTLQEKV